MPIGEFMQEFAALPKQVFLARFDEPFLLVNIPFSEGAVENISALDQWPLSTKTVYDEEGKRPRTVFTLVSRVAKSERGSVAGAITAGRGSRNDVVLPNRCVSRHHAEFQVDVLSGTATVEDRGSSFGTEVDGAALPPKTTAGLENGSTIVFAKTVRCTFLYPEKFYDYLLALSRVQGDQ
ncbi:MAG: FHA domain-containing protein [Planctomycetota bacterium]